MTSDLVREGFKQGGIHPSTFILDFAKSNALAADDSADWTDAVTNTANVITTASPVAIQGLLNDAPAKYALSGTGLNLLVPGCYEGTISLRLDCITSVVQYGLAVVETVATTGRVFYEEDTFGDTQLQMAVGDHFEVSRNFVVDIADPTHISFICVDRTSGAVSGNLRFPKGQVTLKRISKYSAVTRV